MKSICIKTNNSNLLDYLLNELRLSDLKNICFSSNEFKCYKNVIIHYLGDNNTSFIERISQILSYLVLDEMEETLLKNIIIRNYFYFDAIERKKVLNICFDICSEDFTNYFNQKFTCLTKKFSEFLNNHKSIVLSGFVNFRLQNYIAILEELVDEAVNSFIIEREYMEFISLLKLYINSQQSQVDCVHLIYFKDNPILLDQQKNKISTEDSSLQAKYLSDISFSSNDYILNTLLNLLPKKIYIHLVENYQDEFIHTLLLIFEKRALICTDCNICKLYQNHNFSFSTK